MRVLLSIGGSIVLLLAILLHNPLFLAWRPAMTALVFGLSLCTLYALRIGFCRVPRYSRRTLLTLWGGALLIATLQEDIFLSHKQAVLGSHNAQAQRIGAHLIIGYSDPKTMKMLVSRGLVGGIFISTHNVKGRNPIDICNEIGALQTIRRKAGLPPLIVSTDQEGGIVSRLSPPLSRLPSLADVTTRKPLQDIERLAFAYGEQQGRELAELGVNVNFAPLADLSSPTHRNLFDFHSQIGRRAIDTDPARVSPAIIGYAHGLESRGVHANGTYFSPADVEVTGVGV